MEVEVGLFRKRHLDIFRVFWGSTLRRDLLGAMLIDRNDFWRQDRELGAALVGLGSCQVGLGRLHGLQAPAKSSNLEISYLPDGPESRYIDSLCLIRALVLLNVMLAATKANFCLG